MKTFEERCLELFEKYPPKLPERSEIEVIAQYPNGCVSACLSMVTGIPHAKVFDLVHPEYFENRGGLQILFEFFRCTGFDFEVPLDSFENVNEERVVLRCVPSLNVAGESHMIVFLPSFSRQETEETPITWSLAMNAVLDPQKPNNEKLYYDYNLFTPAPTVDAAVDLSSAEWYHDQIVIYR